MEISEFKKYTKNLDAYSARDVEELTPMSVEELEAYQYELDNDTGNNSTWDDVRAIITLKKRVSDIQGQLKELVCAIYEYADEGTELMDIAERIDEME